MQLDRDRDPIGCHVFKAYNYGAAIGVIVAVVLFLALLIGGWIFWYRRRSRQVRSSYLASLLSHLHSTFPFFLLHASPR